MGAGPLDELRLAPWWAKPFVWLILAVALVCIYAVELFRRLMKDTRT